MATILLTSKYPAHSGACGEFTYVKLHSQLASECPLTPGSNGALRVIRCEVKIGNTKHKLSVKKKALAYELLILSPGL